MKKTALSYPVWRKLQAALFCLAFSFPVWAQEMYTVSDVTVDVSAKTPGEARSKAVSEGQGIAFEKLLKRLTPVDQQDRIPHLSAADIQRLAISLRVQKERYSNVRYIATLSYEFDGEGVRRLLAAKGIDYDYTNTGAVRADAPTLVIPVYDSGKGQLLLWEKNNPWMRAWQNTLSQNENANSVAILPRQGLGSVTPLQATNGDWLSLGKLADQNGTRRVVVALARVEADGSLDVEAVRYGQGERLPLPPANPGRVAADASRLAQAASAVLASLDRYRPRTGGTAAASLYSATSTIPVRILIGSLPEWMQMQRKLRAVPLVRGVRPSTLTPSLVTADVRYTGTSADLVDALEMAGLYLVQTTAGWVLDDQPMALEVPMEIGERAEEFAPATLPAILPEDIVPAALPPEEASRDVVPADLPKTAPAILPPVVTPIVSAPEPVAMPPEKIPPAVTPEATEE